MSSSGTFHWIDPSGFRPTKIYDPPPTNEVYEDEPSEPEYYNVGSGWLMSPRTLADAGLCMDAIGSLTSEEKQNLVHALRTDFGQIITTGRDQTEAFLLQPVFTEQSSVIIHMPVGRTQILNSGVHIVSDAHPGSTMCEDLGNCHTHGARKALLTHAFYTLGSAECEPDFTPEHASYQRFLPAFTWSPADHVHIYTPNWMAATVIHRPWDVLRLQTPLKSLPLGSVTFTFPSVKGAESVTHTCRVPVYAAFEVALDYDSAQAAREQVDRIRD